MSNQTQAKETTSAAEKMDHIQSLLVRMQELAQQVASGKCTTEECAGLQQELVGLRAEIERITGSQI